MAGKLVVAVVCLLFTVPFGSVGVISGWAIVSSWREARQAEDWVRVKATVDEASLALARERRGTGGTMPETKYAYRFGGKDYTGSRISLSRVNSVSEPSEWYEEIEARLADAKAGGRSLSAWVNPDNPSQSLLDREMHWDQVVFLLPFALGFGGVGVGGLVFLVRLFAPDRTSAQAAASTGESGPGGFLWVFAFFWNVIAWPITLLVVPQVVADGEWAGLLVLIFPLVGLGVLWAAIATSWKAWKARGTAGAPAKRAVPAVARTKPVPAVAAAAHPAAAEFAARPSAGSFAAQAAMAMFDSPPAAGRPAAARHGEVPIPSSTAAVEEQGGTLTLRYSPRRRMGLAFIVFAIGLVFTFIGALILSHDGVGSVALVLLALGSVLDVTGVSLFVGRLVVVAKRGELAVEQAGLFGRKSWRAAASSIQAIRPVVSYSVNDYPYFTLQAETAGGEHIPLGNSLRGPELAGTVARRVARALGVPESRIHEAP